MSTDLTVYPLLITGRSVTALSTTPVLTGDKFSFVNTGHEYIDVGNYRSEDIAIVYKMPSTTKVDGQTVPDRTVAILQHTDVFVGPFPPEIYNDADGKFTFSITWPTTGSVNILLCVLKPSPRSFIDLGAYKL